jgi:hypothetical protein
MLFYCMNCKFKSEVHHEYYKHSKIHRNEKNNIFKCWACLSSYKSFHSFESHFKNYHSLSNPKSHDSLILHCNEETCGFESQNRAELLNHIRTHFPGNVKCPFCDKFLSNKKYFEVHISRNHRVLNSNSNQVQQESNVFEPILESSDSCQIQAEKNLPQPDETAPIPNQREIMLELFLKLKTENFVCEEVIQNLVEEFQVVTDEFKERIEQKITSVCASADIGQSVKASLLSEIQSIEIFPKLSDMKTSYKRDKLYTKSTHYVKPVEILLGNDNYHQKSHFHYVPILESTKNLIISYGVTNFFLPAELSDDNTYSDIFDGKTYRTNPFFNGPRKIEILLYQDAFELCICIGSARKKFKLLGVYMAFGNIPKNIRFKSENILLVSLCRNKFVSEFGMEKILQPFIVDVQSLETNGIKIGNQVFFGTVVGVAGDNLGQHQLCGMTENFSTTSHICRYCYITIDDLKKNKPNVQELRTIKSYEQDLKLLETQNGNQIHVNGIKHECLLNNLSHFHCFQPGMPPCIAHDLFEGVIQCDLILIIHSFANKNKEFYNFLNISYSSVAKVTKAGVSFPKLEKGMTKMPGKAYENYQFLLLLPYVALDSSFDRNSPQWRMLLCLLTIVRIACAYSLTESQILLLDSTIRDYFYHRSIAFKNHLRPKHHYMCHMPSLIRYFGPLRYWWTLRFEAVHQFYKRAQTNAKNFINVTKSLTHRRQLKQVLTNERRQRSRTDKKHPIFINQKNVLEAIHPFLTFPERFDCATFKMCLDGIAYEKNDCLIIDFTENDEITVLRIHFILVASQSNEIIFCGESLDMWYDEVSGLYESKNESKQLHRKVDLNELLIKKPVRLYPKQNKEFFSLPYFFAVEL